MKKNVELIFPFAENKKANILFVVQIFVAVKEIDLKEGKIMMEKFQDEEDVIIPISEGSLARIEAYLGSFGYVYKVVYKSSPE